MAEILYRETIGRQPRTPQEVADNYGIPVEAVLEAIHFAEHNPDLLDADRAMEQASVEAHGLDRWPYAPVESPMSR
jgi:hypothetical protein